MRRIKFKRIWEKPREKMLPSARKDDIIRSGVFQIVYGDDYLGLDVNINSDGKISLFLPKETRDRIINF